MMDEAARRGILIDLVRLETLLKMPVVGVTAKKKQGLRELKRRVLDTAADDAQSGAMGAVKRLRYPQPVQDAMEALAPAMVEALPQVRTKHAARFASLRLLVSGESFLQRLLEDAQPEKRGALAAAVRERLKVLAGEGYVNERLVAEVIGEGYRAAGELCRAVVTRPEKSTEEQRAATAGPLAFQQARGYPADALHACAGALHYHFGRERALRVALGKADGI